MISRLLRKTYHFTVYAVGILVLTAATTATAIRVFLPDIGMYRGEVEAWVSNYMELPVVIRALDAEWQGWTPHLYLEDVDLLNAAGTSPIIRFNKASISIDIYASLRERQIIPRELTISGFDLGVTRLADGSIEIEGIRMDNYQAQANINDELSRWLFSQKTIELQQAGIVWHDEQHRQDPILLTDVNLLLRSDGDRLQVEGSTSLPALYGRDMNFAIDATGDLMSSDWSAELYVHFGNVQPDKWYRSHWPVDLDISGGDATVSLWSTWKNARLTGVDGRVEYSGFTIGPQAGDRLAVERLDYDFAGREDSGGAWRFNLHLNRLATGNGEWPESDYSLLVEPVLDAEMPHYSMNFSYMKLDDLVRFLPMLLPSMPEAGGQLTAGYALRGDLLDGSFSLDPRTGDEIRFDTGFSGLTAEELILSPMMTGWSGRVAGTLAQGRVSFHRESVEIRLDGDDEQVQKTLEVDGEIAWQAADGEYVLSTELLSLRNEDISTEVTGTVDLSGPTPVVDAVASISGPDIVEAVRYLPSTPLSKVREWIQRSLPGGEVSSVDIVFRGDVADFPFDGNGGRFQARARVANGSLSYAAGWPAIHGIDADILFEGRKMDITLHRGRIFDASIAAATATMPDLLGSRRVIAIDGHIDGNMLDLKRYIEESPLGRDPMLAKAGSVFTGGRMGLDLELDIPIRIPEKKIAVEGRLRMDKAAISSDLDNLAFTDVSGTLSFSRDALLGEGSANFNGHEVRLGLSGSISGGGEPVRASISGIGDESYISSQIEQNFPGLAPVNALLAGRLSGRTNWEASITYRGGEGAGLNRLLQVKSNLLGMAVDLPHPFAKKNYERVNLEFSKELDLAAPRISFTYGSTMSSEFNFQAGANPGLRDGRILFGGGDGEVSARPGISLGGELDKLRLEEWLNFLAPVEAEVGSHSLPVYADLKLYDLAYAGQTFSEIGVSANSTGEDWRILLTGEEIQGEIRLPTSRRGETLIQADLTHLKLKKTGNGKVKDLNPSSIPSIEAHVGSFTYGELDLGTLDVTAVSTDNGLLLEKLTFTKPDLRIEAGGRWDLTPYRGSTSAFSIKAHAAEFGHILRTFGYEVDAIAGGKTRLAIDANWPGSPMAFSLDALNGTVDLKMEKGRLLDIQPSAGRLFGLLSLQTLPRRLVLDFSDLFGEGMAFDTIAGNFTIDGGSAYTDDLAMKGPSVDISIRGRAGLSKQDYDQRAVVIPQISDSLAVASGFLGPVGIGLGAFLYLAGNLFESLQDSINGIMKFEYSITGSWDDPVIEKSHYQPGS